jgi:hypothetical protein
MAHQQVDVHSLFTVGALQLSSSAYATAQAFLNDAPILTGWRWDQSNLSTSYDKYLSALAAERHDHMPIPIVLQSSVILDRFYSDPIRLFVYERYHNYPKVFQPFIQEVMEAFWDVYVTDITLDEYVIQINQPNTVFKEHFALKQGGLVEFRVTLKAILLKWFPMYEVQQVVTPENRLRLMELGAANIEAYINTSSTMPFWWNPFATKSSDITAFWMTNPARLTQMIKAQYNQRIREGEFNSSNDTPSVTTADPINIRPGVMKKTKMFTGMFGHVDPAFNATMTARVEELVKWTNGLHTDMKVFSDAYRKQKLEQLDAQYADMQLDGYFNMILNPIQYVGGTRRTWDDYDEYFDQLLFPHETSIELSPDERAAFIQARYNYQVTAGVWAEMKDIRTSIGVVVVSLVYEQPNGVRVEPVQNYAAL